MAAHHVIRLDGETLDSEALLRCGAADARIEVTKEAKQRVADSRAVIDRVLKSGEVVYGINTGFGLFSNVTVGDDKLAELQNNLIRSHCSGVGRPLSRQQTRMLLALRINVLAKGHSGISSINMERMVNAFNRDCIPVVPSQGTVGASGDLAPLSHLALGLMGEGLMWRSRERAGEAFPIDQEAAASSSEHAPAAEVLAAAGLESIKLGAKEGLAMINGTQLITALGAEAVERAARVARLCDYLAAMTLEVLCGTVRAFDPLIHNARPHRGQGEVAGRVRAVLRPDKPSDLFLSHQYTGKVQDAYSLRCVPQVHGVVHDTIAFVRSLLDVEINSATDNPMVFTKEQVDAVDPWFALPSAPTGPPAAEAAARGDAAAAAAEPLPPRKKPKVTSARLDVAPQSTTQRAAAAPAGGASDAEALADAEAEIKALRKALETERAMKSDGTPWSFYKKQSDTHRGIPGGGLILSGGNFHGEYPAKALDYLAIGVSELGSIAERRIERMCNPSLSGLPAFLVRDGGLNSGFMIAHCTAAALVAENRVLSHPSSVDSISTSGAKEDHVSMGGFAARKAVSVVEHVETIAAIEMLAACQALDLHRPHKTTPPLEALHALVRKDVAPWHSDRNMHPDIQAALKLVQSGEALNAIEDCLMRLQVQQK
jgi:histidine ammonia-lyase